MSGYRQSSFDPTADGDYGPPLRPYNWVQWTGVGFLFVGIAIIAAYLAGRLGWIPRLLDSPTPGTTFVLLSVALVNSRRQQLTSEQSARQRHRALVATGIGLLACALGLAAAFYFKGGVH
jgi:hypothetical protein